MHHFVTYDKKTKEISGTFSMLSNEFLPLCPENIGVVEVTDKQHLHTISARNPMKEVAQGEVVNGKIETLRLGSLFQGKIVLTADATDHDGDGQPELPADGVSSLKISGKVYAADGKTAHKKPVSLRFRSTRGSLSHREMETSTGAAEVELRSAAETVAARVTATAAGFESGALTVQFIPVDEFASFKSKSPRPPKR